MEKKINYSIEFWEFVLAYNIVSHISLSWKCLNCNIAKLLIDDKLLLITYQSYRNYNSNSAL